MYENCSPCLTSKIVLNSTIMGEVSVFSIDIYKIVLTKDISSQKALDALPSRCSIAKYEPLEGEKTFSWCKYFIDVIQYRWK